MRYNASLTTMNKLILFKKAFKNHWQMSMKDEAEQGIPISSETPGGGPRGCEHQREWSMGGNPRWPMQLTKI
ncbi:hypothetical protein FKM82_023226 [Ascaphus truei]